MLVSMIYLLIYQGMILAQMPSMVQVDLVNSTAMELHSDLAGLYHPKGENVYKKVDRHTGRSQYLFIREGGGSSFFSSLLSSFFSSDFTQND